MRIAVIAGLRIRVVNSPEIRCRILEVGERGVPGMFGQTKNALCFFMVLLWEGQRMYRETK